MAPVDSRDVRREAGQPVRGAVPVPAAHVVVRGDTLYSIAFRYGLDYRELARWNGIPDPYVIIPGRRIRLSAPPATAAARTATVQRPAPRPQAAAPAASPRTQSAPSGNGRIEWRWPASGALLRSDSPTARNGIGISGRQGQPVTAAAPGVVVYSGSGLLGYGRLVIIKHDDTYLSAYAHNERLMVQEGDRVTHAQQIATMGLGNAGRPVLHFEIRKDGKPVNPLDYLPKRSS